MKSFIVAKMGKILNILGFWQFLYAESFVKIQVWNCLKNNYFTNWQVLTTDTMIICTLYTLSVDVTTHHAAPYLAILAHVARCQYSCT